MPSTTAMVPFIYEGQTKYQPQSIHPLLIDHVLESILQVLPLNDLRNSRLVCGQWCHVSTSILKKRVVLTFGDGKRDLRKLIGTMCNTQNFPVVKFILQPSIFGASRPKVLHSFMDFCGPTIESLSLAYAAGNSELAKTEFLCNLNLSKLKHLRFEDLQQYSSNFAQYGWRIFSKILSAAVNLQRLDLIINNDEEFGCKVADPYIKIIANSSPSKTLQMLSLGLTASDDHFYMLANGTLSLTTLQINCRNSNFNFTGESLQAFLTSQESTLTKLNMNYRPSSTEGFILTFPHLEKLQTLQLFEWKKVPENLMITSPLKFDYKKFPNIRKLDLIGFKWQASWRDDFFSTNKSVVCESMEEIQLPKDFNESAIIQRMKTIFPNLRKLDVTILPTSIHILQEIFKALTNLEELSVSFLYWRNRICIDYVITGISTNSGNVSNFHTESMSMPCRIKLPAAAGPSITNLKKLKRLELKNLSTMGEAVFTDLSGYFGLLCMNSLHTLNIWQSEMSNMCIQRLSKTYQLYLQNRSLTD